MQERSDVFRMNPVSLCALIGAVAAFIITGAIVDVLWVALGAAVGVAVGLVVRHFAGRANRFAAAVDLRENTSKTELYEQAKDLGIEGRSGMSKDDLVRAISDKQTA